MAWNLRSTGFMQWNQLNKNYHAWRLILFFGTSHCLLDAGRKRQQEAPKEAEGSAKRGSRRPKRGSANWMVSVVHKLCMHDTNYLPYIVLIRKNCTSITIMMFSISVSAQFSRMNMWRSTENKVLKWQQFMRYSAIDIHRLIRFLFWEGHIWKIINQPHD